MSLLESMAVARDHVLGPVPRLRRILNATQEALAVSQLELNEVWKQMAHERELNIELRERLVLMTERVLELEAERR